MPEADSAAAREESGLGTAEVGDDTRVSPVGDRRRRRAARVGAGPQATLGCGVLRMVRTRAGAAKRIGLET
jgi:hypothetical protein